MNNQEAQLILRSYRPGGEDASDPMMAEALEQARHDPELQKWIAHEQAVDASIQGKLRAAVVVPPELKANLLALQKIAQKKSRWRWPIWLAAAASVALLLGISALRLRPGSSDQLDSFRQAMVRYSMEKHEHVAFETSDITKIKLWLQSRDMKPDLDLPGGLRGQPTKGCRVVDWNGQKVALICFVLPDGNHVDFFAMDRADFPSLARNRAPLFAQTGVLMTAAWIKGSQVYLLTGTGDKILIKLLQESLGRQAAWQKNTFRPNNRGSLSILSRAQTIGGNLTKEDS